MDMIERPRPDAMRDAISLALDASGTMAIVVVRSLAGPVVADVSPAFMLCTGWDWAQIVGQLWDVVPVAATGLADRPAQQVRAAMTDGTPVQTELWCRTIEPAGKFLFGMRLVPTGPGQFTLIGRDITAQDAASRQQRAAQTLLARVFASVDTAIAITDEQDALLMTNPQFDRLHGHAPNRLTGVNLSALLTPGSFVSMLAARTAQALGGQAVGGQALGGQAGAAMEVAVQSLHRDGSTMDGTLRAVVTELGADRFRILTLTPAGGGRFRVAGNMRLIGLDAVRRAAGEKWPAMEARSLDVAEQVIERALTPGDCHSRTSEGGFLICFATAVAEEAQFRAATIEREIGVRLLGDNGPAAARLVTVEPQPIVAANLAGFWTGTPDRVAARLPLADALKSVRLVTTPVMDRAGRPIATLVDIPPKAQHDLSAALALMADGAAAGFDGNVLLLTLLVEEAEQTPGLLAGGPVMLPINLDFLVQPGHAARLHAVLATVPGPLRARLTILLGQLRLEQGTRRVLAPLQQLRLYCQDVAFSLLQPELPPAVMTLACGNRRPIVTLPAARLLRPDRERIAGFILQLHVREGRLLAHGAAAGDREALWALGVDGLAGAPA